MKPYTNYKKGDYITVVESLVNPEDRSWTRSVLEVLSFDDNLLFVGECRSGCGPGHYSMKFTLIGSNHFLRQLSSVFVDDYLGEAENCT